MTNLFLSASSPEAPSELQASSFNAFVLALVGALDPHTTLVFGSHPSIVPLLSGATCKLEPHALTRFKVSMGDADNVTWHGDVETEVSVGLASMRDAMVAKADLAVFLGGRSQGIGGRPGLVDEMERFLKIHPASRAHVVTLAGGVAEDLARTQEGVHVHADVDPVAAAASVVSAVKASRTGAL